MKEPELLTKLIMEENIGARGCGISMSLKSFHPPFYFQALLGVAVFSLLALPSSALGFCELSDCKYSNQLDFCRSCILYPGDAHCKAGPWCDPCGISCQIASPAAMEQPGAQPIDADTPIPPDYAYLTEQSPEEDCEGTVGESAVQTVAVWNPTEVLDQIRPYGLSVSNERFKELAEADRYAAYVVGRRMLRGSGLMPSRDMHQGERVSTFEITRISNIDEAKGDSTEMVLEWANLPAGVKMYLYYKDDFDGPENPTITVESYFTVPGKPDLKDHKRTTITLSSVPVYEELVVASDNYYAPVYRVEGFELELLSTYRDEGSAVQVHRSDK